MCWSSNATLLIKSSEYDTDYPDKYLEKYNIAKLAGYPDCHIYLVQYLMKEIREKGRYCDGYELPSQYKQLVEKYYEAYCYANNHQYVQGVQTLSDAIIEFTIVSPILQEYQLLMSQIKIKSIDVVERNEAVMLLSYNAEDFQIDEYLRYRLETRKISAYIHNGAYGKAREQCKKTVDRLICSVKNTHSPGSEYYLNIIYRKYCNIHPYESSGAAIKNSVAFFSKNQEYVRAYYIALNNELALELINGETEKAVFTSKRIARLNEENFSICFPRQELMKNNMLILELVNNNFKVSPELITRFCMLRDSIQSADKIFVSSNLALVYALAGNLDTAIDILQNEYDKIKTTLDHEGVYIYRIKCNLAVIQFVKDNSAREKSLILLRSIDLSTDDPHYSDRNKELLLLKKTMEELHECDSVKKWMSEYQQRVDSPKNYYCLYECGLVFTTLFDWDDE